THPILMLVWLAGALAAVAQAQEAESQAIANWPAPLLWSPPARAVRAASLGEKTSEGIAPLQRETASPPLPFVAITPCGIADTRGNGFSGAYGPPSLSGGVPRDFPLSGQCGIASGAAAVSLNITVTNTQGPGFILIYPQGGAQPVVSTLNYVAGQTVANA